MIGQQPAADSLAKQNMQQVLEKIATSFTACPLKSYRIAKLEHINHILKHSSLKMCAKLDGNWRETFRVIVKKTNDLLFVPLYRSVHIIHNVVVHGVLQAMWEEPAGKVGHRDQLIIC